jgi:glycine/betaine/sarcosine/D-proline reductase family selenoprotein B
VVQVAEMVGANRIIEGNGIVYPLGDANLSPTEEKALRERILRQALDSLQREAGAKA